MKNTILLLTIISCFFSCKKEEAANPEPPKIQNTYTPLYDTITYKAYGGHNWYEIDYMERGVQHHVNPSAVNGDWEYTYTDTVGAFKRLVYKSSLETDTMTLLIIINGATTDSSTFVCGNCESSLVR